MKDWLKERYPNLDAPTLDRLTALVEEIGSFGGKPQTPENFARLRIVSQELQRILGRTEALNLSLEMVTNISRRGNA